LMPTVRHDKYEHPNSESILCRPKGQCVKQAPGFATISKSLEHN
jgi:hypothetical protein